MDLLSRFSTHLKETIGRAVRIATELHNPAVEPIHLLFALNGQKGAVAHEILARYKIDPKILEQIILAVPVIKNTPPAAIPGSIAEKELTPFSEQSRLALEKALFSAQEHNHNYLGTEHLLSSLLSLNNPPILELFKLCKVNPDELIKSVNSALDNAAQFPQMAEVAEAVERMAENMDSEMPMSEQLLSRSKPGRSRKKELALDYFAVNLTDAKLQKNIDPVIGREHEIERIIQILCRRNKNNPVLLGEPGVGKTAIVEGLAKKIVAGTVPDLLLDKKIYALDMGLLLAGTIYRGEFESRLKQIIDEAAADANVILFVDELHNISGAGNSQGAMDAANILKPALARGSLRCIGSTTPSEFKRHIESDAALERRFQPVLVREPSADDAIKILSGIKSNYELYHNVAITDDAVTAAVKLSARYINGKFLPDKAIDLLDETDAAKRLLTKLSPWENRQRRLKLKLEKLILAKENAAAADKFTEAKQLKDEETRVRAEIKKALTEAKTKTLKPVGTVTAHDIAAQLAKTTGVELGDLLFTDKNRWQKLEDNVKKFIVGQDAAVNSVARIIRQAQLELSHPDRPLASLIFVGDSGVGKTELAKVLARVLYPHADALIKLDMSEFSESHSTSKLLGSPAGYIGHKDTNQFTDRVKLNPYSVILFDEIDKAHKDVTKLLLQILEDGEITDATGRKVSLKHAIIILTTTVGAAEVKRGALGFGAVAEIGQTKKRVVEKLKEYFSPELVNRVDEVCLLGALTPANLAGIAKLELARLNERLAAHSTTLLADDKILAYLAAQLPDQNSGARDLRRHLRAEVENLMAEIILKDKIKKNYRLTLVENKLMVK